jgi:lipopolysaccharide biosynthesis glycosyltransferase
MVNADGSAQQASATLVSTGGPATPINVALASDNRGTVGLAVTVHSLLHHTQRPVNVWIIEDGIDSATRARLEASWKHCASLAQVQFLPQNDLPIKIPNWWARDIWPRVAISRFQLAEILPSDVHRCIYLDIDLLIGTDIGELFDQDMQGCPIAMVENYNLSERDQQYSRSLGVDPNRYCNSGVLLMDIDAWRRDRVAAGLIEQARSLRVDLWFFDQDVLNVYFNDRCLLLERRWNCRDAAAVPAGRILHFTGAPKPWQMAAEQMTLAGLAAWRRTRLENDFVPTPPSLFARISRLIGVYTAWTQRQVRRRLSEIARRI